MRVPGSDRRRLDGQPDDPATQLDNLRLDGGHTYFANGWPAHNRWAVA
jgi:hypothetical protein